MRLINAFFRFLARLTRPRISPMFRVGAVRFHLASLDGQHPATAYDGHFEVQNADGSWTRIAGLVAFDVSVRPESCVGAKLEIELGVLEGEAPAASINWTQRDLNILSEAAR